MTIRRTTALAAAATVLSLTALTGCNDDAPSAAPAPAAPPATTPAATPTTPDAAPTSAPTSAPASGPAAASASAPASAPAEAPAGGVIDPEQALAQAARTPYAASQDFRTEGGPLVATTTGRINLNGKVRTGRLTESLGAGGGSAGDPVVVTEDATYVKSGSGWRKSPLGDRIADYHGYAKALLALGPAARKGMEEQNGAPAFHLSGTLDLEKMRAVDAEHYLNLKRMGVTSFQLDQWIDAQGRTVRFDQRVEIRGTATRTYGTFRDFGPVEPVPAPN
ncbi:hypothetical protein ACFV84_13375 [Kitasatospora sp. NPDC059811]|uniref:hypothetical protein n=1 Tax=Streptomycetaceae TaxID=2062 RepID=UPI0007AF44D9|nr:hypothetical protein [Streptomyces sp. MJM8645]